MRTNQAIPISLSSLLITLCTVLLLASSHVYADTSSAPDSTYHYNQATGLWENGTYSWDPATGQTAPLQKQNYSYNTDTGAWDTDQWRYDAVTGSYVPNRGPVEPTGPTEPTGPMGATRTTSTSGDPKSPQTGTDTAIKDSSANSATPSTLSASTPPTTSNDDTSHKDAFFSGFYDASISNTVHSTAQTGDASVTNNTFAGDAKSGDALALVNLINLLQSYWGMGGGDLLTFNQDIIGNVVGDLYIDPKQLQQAGKNNTSNNTVVNQQTNGLIENNVNLNAGSGDATVSSNTSAGDATTGDARAVANLINILNSAISSGQSFMGIINIFGNYEGDILLPQDVLNTLLSSNGPSVPVTNANVNLGDNQSITNNVNTTAQTGTANVSNNTTAGDATTGNASTSITMLNLTGRQIIAKDTLLVFVNVLGRWVGVLMNAPIGSTAAALGSGVTTDTTDDTVGDIELTSTSNQAIRNNITVASSTGNANVSDNTKAGNATSGDASSSVNLLNIIGSNMSFSDWFGVLFINVFGSWYGSFGIDTPYGNPTTPNSSQMTDDNRANSGVFSFSPGANTPNQVSRITYYVYGTPVTGEAVLSNTDGNQQTPGILAAIDQSGPSNGFGAGATLARKSSNVWALPLAGMLIGMLLLGGNSAYDFVQKQRSSGMPQI